jgi:hypothetical protein
LVTRNNKLKLHLTLIRTIVTYGAKTWARTESELQKLLIFERKILRKIYGPVEDQDTWRIRTNSELDTLTGGVNIVRYIKAQRLRWFGHIQRMEHDRMVKKLTTNHSGKDQQEDPRIDGSMGSSKICKC